MWPVLPNYNAHSELEELWVICSLFKTTKLILT